eukprot:2820900-Rhodomonas_salina.1
MDKWLNESKMETGTTDEFLNKTDDGFDLSAWLDAQIDFDMQAWGAEQRMEQASGNKSAASAQFNLDKCVRASRADAEPGHASAYGPKPGQLAAACSIGPGRMVSPRVWGFRGVLCCAVLALPLLTCPRPRSDATRMASEQAWC